MTWRRRSYQFLILGVSLPCAAWGVVGALFALAGGERSALATGSLAVSAGCIYLNLALYRNARDNGFWEHVDSRTCVCGHPAPVHPGEHAVCLWARSDIGDRFCCCTGFVARPVWWRRVLGRA